MYLPCYFFVRQVACLDLNIYQYINCLSVRMCGVYISNTIYLSSFRQHHLAGLLQNVAPITVNLKKKKKTHNGTNAWIRW